MKWISWIAVFCSLGAVPARASYRVYQLLITEYNPAGRMLIKRVELSTLDHLQWEHVYSSYRSAKVELLDTWYCPGDTSRRAYCPKPKNVKTRGPASTIGNRVDLPYNRQPVIP